MSRFCLFICILFLAAGCAPEKFIKVRTTRQPKATNMKPSYPCVVKPLRISETVPRKFKTNFSYENVEYRDGKLTDAISKEISQYLSKTGLFKSILTPSSKRPEAYYELSGKIKKFHWQERTGTIPATLLAGVTAGLYPLLGLPVTWPEAEVELEVTLKPIPKGKSRTYISKAHYSDWVSIYGAKNDSPNAQLMEAFTLALEDIHGQISKAIPKIIKPSVSKPPLITFISPKVKETLKNKVHVTADVVGREFVSSLKLLVNGKEEKLASMSNTPRYKLEREIKLTPGRNVIKVIAWGEAGKRAEKEITITRIAPPVQPEWWGTLVCVDEVPAFKWKDNARKKNANALHKSLLMGGRAGWNDKRTWLLHGKKASLNNIFNNLFSNLKQAPEKNPVLFLFSGPVAVAGSSPDKCYFLAADSVTDKLDTTALPFTDFSKALKTYIRAENVLVILDINCLPFGGNMDKLLKSLCRDRKGLVIIAHTRKKTTSKYDLFSAVKSALDGKADKNADGVVTVKELTDYFRKVDAEGGKLNIYGTPPKNLAITGGK